jgi:hypothetical protein
MKLSGTHSGGVNYPDNAENGVILLYGVILNGKRKHFVLTV